jgi:hypothetical protein
MLSKGTRKPSIFALLLAVMLVLVVLAGGLLIVRKRGVPFVGKVEQWSIGIYRSDSPFSFPTSGNRRNPVLTAQDVTDVPAKFVADPFLAEDSSTWYLFFEVYNTDTQQGDLAVATSENTRKWKYERVVLDEPFHLSYPYVFRWQNEYYLIPESFEANAVRLYKAVDFPHQWSFVGSLIDGGDFVDPSIVRVHEKWWIFVSSVSEPNSLQLFYADDLLGPWTEHPASPIATGADNMARPAGRVLVYDGRVFRFQQDLDEAWGHRVWAFEVTDLTTTSYREEKLSEDPILEASGSGWNEKAMHHIDPHQVGDGKWIASVDGFGTYLVFGLEY